MDLRVPLTQMWSVLAWLLGRCQLSSSSNMSSYQVQLTTADSFTGTEDVAFKGKVSHEFTYVTVALLAERDLVLETNCSISETPSGVGRIPGYSTPCSLGIIIYGPMELFDDIGSFFEEYNLYLQDPIDCKRNVRYCNPHRLSVDPSASKLTFDLCNKPAQSVTILEVDTHPEMLDVLYSQEDLAETAQPGSIKTTLEKHQRQALTFMLQRENGWAWDGGRADIWEVRDTGHEPYFYNTVSGVSQAEQPPQFYGGICADPMGLGKTLSMIALIACDLRVDDADPASLPGVDIEESSGKTLVILPPPLLISWEEQLQRHVFPNSLPWCRHHGKSRLRDSSELNDVLIVLTTYHTVMAEWRNAAGTDHSILLKTKWKRIVLDEAHFIRNTDSQMARAICSLDSVSRWAVTGTPIQNKLGDLAALLKFLKVHPYSEKRQFDSDVSNLWKSGHVEKAVERLKRLSACLLLRRPKETVQLPPRQDLQYSVEFTQAERQLYEDVRSQVISHIDEAILQRDKSASSDFFINVLQRIEAMRMVCDLGVYYHSRHETFTSCGQPEKGWPDEAQRAFNLRREMGPIQCEGCRSSLDTLDDVFSESGQTRISLFSRCLAFLCYTCSQRHTSDMGFCHHEPLCPVASISTDSFITEDPSPTLQGGLSHGHPSKVAMLLDDLRTLPADTKCVVFSTWRMTLNVVDAGLKQACMPALRFDGTIPQKDRQRVLDQFRNDASIRVLLLTLTCGAVGLTLTEASRAYLMEPHWNPTLEDQALARIHRIGQTRAVTTIRFFMRDSFEERIIQVQDSKRDLAGILLNPPNSEQGEAERGSGRLEVWDSWHDFESFLT
ncbi:SNF2 family N-terminal domain-containing protein [Thelonectria olida]|uniref:SNF2 family N-terminal domain-containing protein n=1 Tax=Thelonectria olida TaxID=1576542 RepID=A0A9P8VV61_9HYPO|nr:SNF2 family N-terminal domain-containing protein [Thelonectria olida]